MDISRLYRFAFTSYCAEEKRDTLSAFNCDKMQILYQLCVAASFMITSFFCNKPFEPNEFGPRDF